MLRQGRLDAYAVLFARHSPAAIRRARRHTRDHQLVQDAVQGAFANILAAVQSGHGPVGTFTGYLHASVTRHIQRETMRRRREILVPYDEEHLALHPKTFPEVAFNAYLVDDALQQAFQSLPKRWQLILWHIDVTGMPPREIAPVYGITPNALVALHRRAKTGLRRALSKPDLVQFPAQRTLPPAGATLLGATTHKFSSGKKAIMTKADSER
ncbi:RNA polymerase sigma factor [Paenarthrobacter sp. NPDC056912]|uniref:RNA polymerase sigma factor n=1 Tax=Paenarthrobacter sp. NPDC056912 TaxID=3345965 RepID=UPI00366F1D61